MARDLTKLDTYDGDGSPCIVVESPRGSASFRF
jgi:hypothetical protein